MKAIRVKMTFQEFRGSKRLAKREELNKILGEGFDGSDGASGEFLIYGEPLVPCYIQVNEDEVADFLGKYTLILGRDEWGCSDLMELEKILYNDHFKMYALFDSRNLESEED